MEVSKLATLEKIDNDDFLSAREISDSLRSKNTSEVLDFRNRCREFIDHLVEGILYRHAILSAFTWYLLFLPGVVA